MKGHLQCGHRLNSNSDHTSGGSQEDPGSGKTLPLGQSADDTDNGRALITQALDAGLRMTRN